MLVESFVVGALSSVLGHHPRHRDREAAVGVVRRCSAIDLPSGALQIQPRTIIVSFLVGTGRHAGVVARARAPRVADRRRSRRCATRRSTRRRAGVGTSGAPCCLGHRGGGDVLRPVRRGLGEQLGHARGRRRVPRRSSACRCSVRSWPRPRRDCSRCRRQRTGSITGTLARENAERNPRRTASTAAALMIGLALVTAVADHGRVVQDARSAARSRTRRRPTSSSRRRASKGSRPRQPTQIRDQIPDSTVVQYRFGTHRDRGRRHRGDGRVAELLGDDRRRAPSPARTRTGSTTAASSCTRTTAEDKGYKIGQELDVNFPDGPGTVTVQGFFDDKKAMPSNANYILSLADWDHFADPLDFYVGVIKPDDVSTKQRRRRSSTRLSTASAASRPTTRPSSSTASWRSSTRSSG